MNNEQNNMYNQNPYTNTNNNNLNQNNYYDQSGLYYQTVTNEIGQYHKKRNRKRKISKFFKTIIVLAIITLIGVWGYNYFTTSDTIKTLSTNIKKQTLADDAISIINVARKEIAIEAASSNRCYNLNHINQLVRRKLVNSPFKANYLTTSYVKATLNSNNNYIYSICLVDEQGNGIELTKEENITKDVVKVGTAKKCSLPPGCY